jgi:hypothetical protein
MTHNNMEKRTKKWGEAEESCPDLNRLFDNYTKILIKGAVVNANCSKEGCPVKLRISNVYWHGVFPLGKAELLSEGCIRARERR